MNKELTNQEKIEIFEKTIKKLKEEIRNNELVISGLENQIYILKLNKNIKDIINEN